MKLTLKLVFLAFFFAMAVFAAFRPVFVGYSVKDAVPAEKMSGEDALLLNISLSHCSSVNELLLSAMERGSGELMLYAGELGACRVNSSLSMLNHNAEVGRLENELLREKERSASIAAASVEKVKESERVNYEKEKELGALMEHYGLLAFNAANNICCKQRIDQPKIGFYAVENDRVVCSDSGTLRLSC